MISWTEQEIDSHCSAWLVDMKALVPDFRNVHPVVWIETELSKLTDKLKGL